LEQTTRILSAATGIDGLYVALKPDTDYNDDGGLKRIEGMD
jgi:hypothetical protein